MQQNFWEQGNLMKVNFREHLNLFLENKGKTPIFSREQGNMYPPPPPPPGRPSLISTQSESFRNTLTRISLINGSIRARKHVHVAVNGACVRGGRAKRPMTFQTNYLYWICSTSKIKADNVNKENRNYCESGSLV